MAEKVVLIDTDAGTDDAWGLFMALAAHRDDRLPWKIVGITCTHGNTSLHNVTVNVTRILSSVGEKGIPVYGGAESALVFPLALGETPYHGKDGFGDADFPPLEPVLEGEHAVNAIIRLAQRFEGNLSILALGPLTNLAMAIRLQSKLKSQLKEIFILGGNYQGRGNTTVLGEFNFLADAESAHIVLESYAPCPIFLCPWETCVISDNELSFRVDTLGGLGTPQVALMNAAEAKILVSSKVTDRWSGADQIVTGVLIDSAMLKKSVNYHCTVELGGNHARGMMVTDKGSLQEKHPNCTIIQEIDLPLYEKMLIWAAGGPFYKDQN